MKFETVTFPEVALTGKKRLKCPKCDTPVRRQQTFFQTLSPYNRDKTTGRPKTAAQIQAELQAELEKWKKAAEMCTPCWNKEIARRAKERE